MIVFLADAVQRVAEADGRRRLALAGRGRADRGDENELAVGPVARLRRKSYSSLAMKRPNGCRADSGAPILAAISAIGFRRAARAISMSDAHDRCLPLDPPLGGRERKRNESSAPLRFASANRGDEERQLYIKRADADGDSGSRRARRKDAMTKPRLALFTALSVAAYLGTGDRRRRRRRRGSFPIRRSSR